MVKNWLQKSLAKLKFQFESRLYKSHSREVLVQRRPYILPSKFGVFFGLGILVLLLLAFTYANQLIYLIAFFYSSFLFIVMHLTNNNIKYLSLEHFNINPEFLDRKIKLHISIQNQHQKYNSRFIEVRLSPQNKLYEIPLIRPGETISFTIDLAPNARGLFPYPIINLSTKFPFSLFYSWKRFHWKFSYFVYPAREGEQAAPILNREGLIKLGLDNRSLELAPTGNFLMHKEHTPYDSFKRIDWKVFARKNKLFIKVYDEENPSIMYIDIAQYLASPQNLSFEKKVSQLTKWIHDSSRNSQFCFVKLPHQEPRLLETPKDFDQVYEFLALTDNGIMDTYAKS